MMMDMIFSGHQNKIVRGIIKFIPINMVNQLMSFQGTSYFDGHNMAMFKNSMSFNINHPIALRSNAALTISPFLTKKRVSIADKSQIMTVTESVTSYGNDSTNGTGIRFGMFNKFASLVLYHPVHIPSLATKLLQMQTVVKRDSSENGVNSGEALTDYAEGNPEPSQGYTLGRCNDYRRGKVPLMTGMSAPPERDEIVYSLWKHKVKRYTTDINGVGLEKPAAKGATGLGRAAIAGVCAETIAASAYGLVQVWGYHSAVRVYSSTTGSGAVAAGTALNGPKTAWYALANVGKTGTQANCYPKGFALAANASYTTKAIAAFIQCL